MVVLAGMMYFWGGRKSSVRNHPLMSGVLPVGLYNSIASPTWAPVWVKISLITTAGRCGGTASFCPGEPPTLLLGRQLVSKFQALVEALSLTVTREKPSPSVAGYQSLS